MERPSGDQTGERSCAAVVLVRLRTSPFSAGTVTISPRNSTATRTPEGESEALRMYLRSLVSFTNRGRVSARSAATPIVSFLAEPPAGSKRWR